MTEVALEASHLTKRFLIPVDHGGTLQHRAIHPIRSSRHRELVAVRDVSFVVQPGKFLGITGPNGCGKSTLLKLVAGIYEPDGGSLKVRGSVSPFLELGVGFKSDLTARENVILGGSVLGLTRRQIAPRVAEVLEFAGVEEFADQKLRNFSSGMSVRLAFSVALLADADILLMDEVLAVGDARFQQKCFEVFEYYKRMRRTIILVTHDLGALDAYCDRVLLMEAGRITADGPASEVTAKYRRLVGSTSDADDVEVAAGEVNASRRWGTREVEVTAIEMRDGQGRPCHTFVSGEPLAIMIRFRANSDVDEYECGIIFQRGTGQQLAVPVTKYSRHRLPPLAAGETGMVQYQIDRLALLQGNFALTVAFVDQHLQHVYDRLEEVRTFRIVDPEGRAGMVEVNGEWSHVVDDRMQPAIPSSGRGIRSHQ